MRGKKLFHGFLAVLLLSGMAVGTYAQSPSVPALSLSNEERAYFATHKTLRVLTVPANQPYSYRDMGLSIDILNRLCETADITLETVEAKNCADALQRLDNGEAEISAVKFSTPHVATTHFIPYLRSPIQNVAHKDETFTGGQELVLAQLAGLDFAYDERYGFVESEEFDTVKESLYAVRSRRADIFLCDLYQLSPYAQQFGGMDLVVTNLPQRELVVGFGLAKDLDPALVSALKKAVDAFSTSELSFALLAHAQNAEPVSKLINYVYQNPFELICAFISLFFVALICIFVYTRVRVGQYQELRGYEESYRMLADTFGEAGMEYDFLTDQLTLFGEQHERLDLPDTTEGLHKALEQKALRISLTPAELDALLEKNQPGRSYEVEMQCGMREGGWNWFRMIYIVVCTSESHRRPIRLIGCLVNIEQEHLERERLLRIGHNDQLTGLLNRVAAEEALNISLREDDTSALLLFIDIDHFKRFNDRYGHACGDAVLERMGAAMRESFLSESILCRWGGDEFMIFLKIQETDPNQAENRIRNLQEKMRNFTYQDRRLPVTLSIGGVWTEPDSTFKELFNHADKMLYAVKDGGRNHFRFAPRKTSALTDRR